MSEQPCFYDVLCGKNGENAHGVNQCIYEKNGMVVVTLDRNRYPNGVTKGIWNTTDGEIPLRYPEVIALHNNWIKGFQKRLRFERHGLILFNREVGLCTYSLRTSPTA